MYQCSDISVVPLDGTNDCDKPWQNGGIWSFTKCVWLDGFYGDFCEKLLDSNQPEQKQNLTAKTIYPAVRKQKKNNGINYLSFTPEAENINKIGENGRISDSAKGII